MTGRRRPTDGVRRIALYGFLASGNLGNDASLETVLAWLRERHPQVRPSCITIAPGQVRDRYGIPAIALAHPGVPWFGRVAGRLLGRLADVPRSLALAGSADAVVVPGMGVLEESLGVRPWGLPAWMFLTALACRLRRRPFVLLDVGAEPVTDPVTRWLFVATARLAAHVSYRDEWSARSMAVAGAPPPAAVAPDLAFAHPDRGRPQPQAGLVVVGVMAFHGPTDDPVAGAPVRERYVRSLAAALVRLVEAGDRVVLVGGDRVDTAIGHRVRAEILANARADAAKAQVDVADRITVRDVVTFGELSEQLARAEVVIASRFHNLICALRLGRPTVSIGYAEKNARLMQGFGLSDHGQRIEELDPERLLAQIRAVRADGATLSCGIARRSGAHISEVETLLDRVAQDVLGLPPAPAPATISAVAPTPPPLPAPASRRGEAMR